MKQLSDTDLNSTISAPIPRQSAGEGSGFSSIFKSIFPEELTTGYFTVTPATYARLSLLHKSAMFWMALALPLLILIIAGFIYDTRLLYVAAVVIFILFPTLLLIAWQSLLTRPDAIHAMFPHQVQFNHDDEICIRYTPLPTPDSASDSASDKSKANAASTAPAEEVIPASAITDCRFWGDYLEIVHSPSAILLIPLRIFPDTSMPMQMVQHFARFT